MAGWHKGATMADNLNFNSGITINHASAAMVAGSTSTYLTTVTTNCCINGKFAVTLAAQTNTASPTADATTGNAFLPLAPNKCCALVFGQNLAGAIKLCQGPIIDTIVGVTTTVGALLRDPQFPPLPDDFCPLAYTIVRTAPSAASWTPGTSSWTASGVSASTFQNVSQLPNRPQSS
jgi:hypothetical protein